MTFLFNKSARWLLAALLPLALFSCKKDEIRSREMLVFLQPDQAGIPTQTQTLSFLHTPADVRGERTTELRAYSSRELTEAAAELTILPAPEQLAAYNERFNLQSSLLPAGAYSIASGQTYRIEVGQRASNPVQIEITHPEELTDPNGYVLPLSIEQVSSKDKGLVISQTHQTVYLRILYNFTNVETTEVVPAGSLVNRSAWTVAVSNTTNGAPASNLLDGNNSSVWRSSNSSTAAKWIEIDMGAALLLKGLQFSPNYTNSNENGTRMTISSSNDNNTWTEQGVWTGTGPTAGTNATNPDLKGIQFIAPVTARYFRITFNSWVSGNRVGMAELNAVE